LVFVDKSLAPTAIWTRSIALVSLMSACAGASADQAADQLERARLLRDLVEMRSASPSMTDAASLPGARIGANPAGAREAGRRQQFEDSQWRKLLGSQQMQTYAPPNQAVPERQWRMQTFDRERSAEDLSADILRRSQELLSNARR
jgi:hypothetical protein